MNDAAGARELAERAGHLNELRRHRQAEEVARRGLSSHPRDVDLFLQLGAALEGVGNLSDALQCAGAAVQLAPHDPRPHHFAAVVLVNLARGPEAIVAARRAMALAPQAARSHQILAHALCSTHSRHPEALVAARRAVEIDPLDPGNQTTLGTVLLESGRWYNRRRLARVADEHLATALAISPFDTAALNERGRAAMHHAPLRAAKTLSGAVRIDPQDAVLRHNVDVALQVILRRAFWLMVALGLVQFAFAHAYRAVTVAVACVAAGAAIAVWTRLRRTVLHLGGFLRGFAHRETAWATATALLLLATAAHVAAAASPWFNGRIVMTLVATLSVLGAWAVVWIDGITKLTRR